jgi:hypothetical protein
MTIEPTPFQRRVLAIPEEWSIALMGGRGGGKTFAALLRIVRHLAKYGKDARVLILRENYKGLLQIEETMLMLLEQSFPGKVRWNRAEHLMRIDGGGTVEMGQIESFRDVSKFIGRESTLIFFDDVGQLREFRFMNLIKSNLRSPAGVPLSVLATGNPGGAQHMTLKRLYLPHVPWRPFQIENETWVLTPSTMEDNPFLDHADYKRRIESATNDAGLRRAWIENDWSVEAGICFSSFSEADSVLPVDVPFRITRRWAPYVGMDWGTSAPACALFMGRCPGDVPGIPAGSVVVFDEFATHAGPDELNKGLGYPPGVVAEEIIERCKHWNMPWHGVCDDSYGLGGSSDTLLTLFREDYNLHFEKPQSKNRVGGWSTINGMFANAAERNGKPGLYISERCGYLLSTLPLLTRDPRRPEDILTTLADHAADALRYGISWRPWMPPAVQRLTTGF